MTAAVASVLGGKQRVLHAIVLREMRVRFARRQLGYLWALFEPLVHVSVFMAVFELLQRVTPVQEGMVVFLGTGVLPWLLFTRTVSRVSGSASANKALLIYPHISPIDFMLCRILIESATFLIVAVFLAALAFFISGFTIEDPLGALVAWVMISVFGGAVGMINAVILENAPSYDNFWTILQRLLYLTSGIFFLADDLPEGVREISRWSPPAQAIDWFRDTILPSYNSDFHDAWLFSAFALALFCIGMMLERFWRKELRTP